MSSYRDRLESQAERLVGRWEEMESEQGVSLHTAVTNNEVAREDLAYLAQHMLVVGMVYDQIAKQTGTAQWKLDEEAVSAHALRIFAKIRGEQVQQVEDRLARVVQATSKYNPFRAGDAYRD